MDKKSLEHHDETDRSLLPPLSRRAFLAGAATCAAVAPTILHAAVRELGRRTLLHVATRESHTGYVHTFALISDGCTLLGSTSIDSFAALAPHPALPVLYVARDCREWENLPRGVIESYAIEPGAHPLRLLTQTPMALSATGPRSLAVSSCGRYLLVSASTGGAWNAFALNRAGVPASVAIARKEAGRMLDARAISLPTPHGLVFSPHEPFALGADPGSCCIALLQPSSERIAVLARCQTPHGLTPTSPAWTSDGRYIIVANAQSASLSIYEMPAVPGEGSNASFRLLGTTPTVTPVTALLAHPSQPAVFTSRSQGSGSRLEIWRVDGSHLRLVSDTWVSSLVIALAQNTANLWAVSQDRLIRIPTENLHTTHAFEVPLPMHGAQAIVTQSVAAHPLDNV
jgi:6-phosphogluconolactonase (cycloisomerase 2 family)